MYYTGDHKYATQTGVSPLRTTYWPCPAAITRPVSARRAWFIAARLLIGVGVGVALVLEDVGVALEELDGVLDENEENELKLL